MDKATKIWNRAALSGSVDQLRQGDVALAAILRAHGMVMNGGLYHAIEDLSEAELDAAIRGYRYFSLNPIAELFESARSQSNLPDADAQYAKTIPDDGAIEIRFSQILQASPEQFCEI